MDPDEQNDFPHADVVAIRQSFYEGLAGTCLKFAWKEVDDLRRNRCEFLGRRLAKPLVSQQKIATSIDRSAGEICRWLQGESPNWANLMIVMLVLEASWPDLKKLPTKNNRKRGGYAYALHRIQRRLLNDTSEELSLPTELELQSLEVLFAEPQWKAARHFEPRRARLLPQLAENGRIEQSVLDAADKAWGTAFAILQRAYIHCIDVAIWR